MDALTTPSNWQRVRLGDIATFLKGKGLSKNQVSPNAKHECILYGELFTHYDRVVTNIKNFTNIYDNPMLSLNNDVLMPSSDVTPNGLATASCILKKGVILGGDILIIRPNSNLLNGCFLAYCIVYDKNQVLSKVVGSTVYHLYAKDMKVFEILLPPLNEQIAIANILSALDRYLYALRALILKKESVKKALSFELLSQRKRLKGFNQNWQRVRLGDIATFLKGKGLSKNQVSPNAKHECILYGELFTHYDRVVTNIKNFTNIYDNPMLSLNNDVLMPSSDVTPNGLATASCILKKGVILGGDILIIRPNSNLLNGCFLAYCIVYDKNQVLSKVVGSTVYHLYAKDMKVFEILLPPLNEQIAIANILSNVDSEIISLKNKKRQFENIKKALNHDLMSAKIRVLKK
ncbi:restriction endonuclease subunit S [Helicobacter pylori]|uniref:restriction endonuclease subunit S n=1 Tax=Helicobacter pylori TaxID=210 RepID=UPI00026B450D|nr:restriction endonuclease subunit S [Helicobacter pylori]EJC34049.1 type I restriction modification DNA specificity domain protein [Helicobacter pylori Hp P-15b]